MEGRGGGVAPVSWGWGSGAGGGRRQGWANGSQAAVHRGRGTLPLLLPPAAAALSAITGGAYKIASKHPPK